jgi:hypothetical protein
MKRLILATLWILLSWPLSAIAGTLACDPQAGVQYYLVDGLPAVIAPTAHIPAQADGSLALVIDALPSVMAIYTIKAKACVLEECSEWSAPFTFPWPLPKQPGGFRIRK